MRLHLIEHDPEDFSRTNISAWAVHKGYPIRQTFVCNGESVPSLDDFDWLMVMGGSQHAWDEDKHAWLRDEKIFLRAALASHKIVLGICFGAQLLAEALGGRVFPSRHREIGWHEVKLNPVGRASFLFQGIPSSFTTFHWHSDHFSLPENCAMLASSPATENQAFLATDRPLVGLQFHPEYTCDMVKTYAREHSQDWLPDVFVSPEEKVLNQTESMPDTYWLMEALLNNMDRAFVANT